MHELSASLIVTGSLVLILGLFSGFLKRRTFITEPVVALLVGVLLGPGVLGVLDIGTWGDQHTIIEGAARLTLAIGLMAIALRLPPDFLTKHWRSLLLVLGVVTPFMWAASGLLTYLLLGTPFWVAMLIGASLTPTDPIVATSIVTGEIADENLPEHLHDTISVEAGVNDGLAYPLVLLPILLLTGDPGDAWLEWFVRGWLWEFAGALALGVLLGYVAGRLLAWSEAQELLEGHSFLATTLALSLLVLGTAELLRVESIFAVFAAGLAFDRVVGGKDRAEEDRVQEVVNQFFFIPMFVLLGLTIPWDGWRELGWHGLLLAVAVLIFRRLPIVLLLAPLISMLPERRDALFFGWFGPIGVSAILFAMVTVTQTGLQEVWTVTSLVVSASVLAHGLSANPWVRWLGRVTGNAREPASQ